MSRACCPKRASSNGARLQRRQSPSQPRYPEFKDAKGNTYKIPYYKP